MSSFSPRDFRTNREKTHRNKMITINYDISKQQILKIFCCMNQ